VEQRCLFPKTSGAVTARLNKPRLQPVGLCKKQRDIQEEPYERYVDAEGWMQAVRGLLLTRARTYVPKQASDRSSPHGHTTRGYIVACLSDIVFMRPE
jgi:hypothetical protein